ncbi:MAG TPA: hypothetical protein VGK30_00745 [Candidatus Binatia bacterium]
MRVAAAMSHDLPLLHAWHVVASYFAFAFSIAASVFWSVPNGGQGPAAFPLFTPSQHFWIAFDSTVIKAAALLPIAS